MVIHTFFFRWKPEVADAEKQRALMAVRALEGQIPGILASYVGMNFSERAQGYALGGVMHFADRAALEAYTDHPVHRELVGWLMPLIEPLEVDFEC